MADPPGWMRRPAGSQQRTLMIFSSVNLLLRMSVSRRNGLYLKPRTFKESRSRPLKRFSDYLFCNLRLDGLRKAKANQFPSPIF